MKKFFQISLLLTSLFVFGSVAQMSAQKIAVVDTDALLSASPEMKRAKSQLEVTQKQFQTRLAAKEQKFQKRYGEIMELAAKQQFTQQQELTFQNELKALQTDLATSQAQMEKDLLKKEEDYIKPIFDKLKANITTVAKEKGYRYVFNKDSLIYYPPSDDITALVKQKLGYK